MRKSKNLMQHSLRVSMTMLFVLFASIAFAQNINVRGSVKDTSGEPVIGANVRVQGASTGVITDMNGNYSIICSSRATLQFSYIGYAPQTVAVGGRKVINVVLSETSNSLNEVVVTAMGIKKDAKKLGYAVDNIGC
jgi:iron complex outermembrane receptor protein